MKASITLLRRWILGVDASPVVTPAIPITWDAGWFQVVVKCPVPVAVRSAIEVSSDNEHWHEIVRFPDTTGQGSWVARLRESADATVDVQAVTPANLALPATDGYVYHGPLPTHFRAVTQVVSVGADLVPQSAELSLQLVTTP